MRKTDSKREREMHREIERERERERRNSLTVLELKNPLSMYIKA